MLQLQSENAIRIASNRQGDNSRERGKQGEQSIEGGRIERNQREEGVGGGLSQNHRVV